MKVISKVVIENFRSLKRVEIDPQDVNVFSGLNDVGKSNVLKALNLFFNDQTDFQIPLKFAQDFSKIALASAQRARKQKQQIKIRVYFSPPASFPSLKSEKEVYLERVFGRDGTVVPNYSTSNSKKQAQITRLYNKIRYFYIPALKGPDVLRFVLGRIGEHQLISSDEITKLNDEVNKNLSDLRGILSRSDIAMETTVGFPVFVRDFWERMLVNTKYDSFQDLDSKTKGKSDPLKEEFYQIPLELRGEGIKSKYIPPLLRWIQQRNSDIYVWGIDEPENSLEFSKARDVAKLYFDVYARDTQLFLTTHSFAFIFAESTEKQIHTVTFRCLKGNIGQTDIYPLESLFKQQDRIGLAEEMGALEIQKEVYADWKKKDVLLHSKEDLIRTLNEGRTPVLLVEGPSDKEIIETAWQKLFKTASPFVVEIGGGGSGYQKNFIKNPALKIANRDKLVALWDCDSRAFADFQDLPKNGFDRISPIEVKHQTSSIWGLLLPTPSSRTNYTNVASGLAQLQFLEIEHYFDDSILQKTGVIAQTLSNGVRILKEDRTPLFNALKKLKKKDFTNFKPLFKKLKSLYGVT